jgi:cysteine synthase A
MHLLAEVTGRRYGGSTGTNLCGIFQLAAEMADRGESGSIVTLACDPGDRYLDTYYDRNWLTANGYDIDQPLDRMRTFIQQGRWKPAPSSAGT